MRHARVWQQAFGLTDAVIEGVDFDDEAVVVSARPCARDQRRCGHCGQRSPAYDKGEGRRRWRALDLGSVAVFIEADAPRVRCAHHGVVVARVPWARHDVGHTRDFDDTVAWLVLQCSKSAVVELMRVAWRTVGAILARVRADIDAELDRLSGLSRIGIDEISYKRNHHYLTVVVDHDTRRLVWAAPGRGEATLHTFFDALGPERSAMLREVSCDLAPWIGRVVSARAPQVRCGADPFHVVTWAMEALDAVRRQVWNEAAGRRRAEQGAGRFRRTQATGEARALKRARYALWKDPEHLTPRQRHQLDWITTTHPRLWRAYLLKEGLRHVFAVGGEEGKQALDGWISWARRSRLPAFVELSRRIVAHRDAIDITLETGLSNALVESTNTKIRLLARIAFGFHGPEPLIALAMLALGGHRPSLPRRN